MAHRFSVACLSALFLLLLLTAPRAAAQKPGSPTPPRAAPTPPNPTPGGPFDPLNTTPTHSLIVYGSLTLPDGSPPAQLVVVERVCEGITQVGGFADSKGRFSFDLGVLNRSLAESSIIDRQSNNQLAGKVIQIYPGSFPRAHFLNAWAHLRLQHFDLAEKSAMEGIKLDGEHHFPELEFVAGMALPAKHDREGATKHLEAYLALAPRGVDTALAQKQLASLRSAR